MPVQPAVAEQALVYKYFHFVNYEAVSKVGSLFFIFSKAGGFIHKTM